MVLNRWEHAGISSSDEGSNQLVTYLVTELERTPRHECNVAIKGHLVGRHSERVAAVSLEELRHVTIHARGRGVRNNDYDTTLF